jgi:hypothetical protein
MQPAAVRNFLNAQDMDWDTSDDSDSCSSTASKHYGVQLAPELLETRTHSPMLITIHDSETTSDAIRRTLSQTVSHPRSTAVSAVDYSTASQDIDMDSSSESSAEVCTAEPEEKQPPPPTTITAQTTTSEQLVCYKYNIQC